MDIITAFEAVAAATAMALAFLTILPMPQVEWTPARLRYFPLVLPLVGLVLGLLTSATFALLLRWKAAVFLRAVLLALGCLAVTGGLHMDGLMDACDAFFSRKDRESRLAILSDTHVGAFAVMGCASVLLLKTGIFVELLTDPSASGTTFLTAALTLIPVYSRTGMGLLFYLPFAREDGLARMLGGARLPRDRRFLLAAYFLSSAAFLPLLGSRWLIIPLTGGLFFLVYRLFCLRIFGGISGDLMGAFAELSETLMLLAAAAMKG